MSVEKWKIIKEYPRYSVSNFGNVMNNRTKILKKLSTNSNGYIFVNLYKDDMNRPAPKLVHILVCKEFLCGETKETVNHKNGIKNDNNIGHWEWMTRQENSSHAWKIGLTPILKGESCGKSVLNNEKVINIRKMYSEGLSQKQISNLFKVTQANISEIVRYRTWKHI